MANIKTTRQARIRRHNRIRQTLSGTAERPRLAVFKSNKNITAQLIDDVNHKTLGSASTTSLKIANGGNIEAATKVGEAIAKVAADNKITTVVFDRGGNLYHGRVKALADAAREAGLKF
jgi:large subunit ribosomal protein L18